MPNARGVAYQPAPGSKGFRLILKILFGAFAAFGAVFLLVGIFWLQSDREFYASAETVQGEIIDFVSETDGTKHPIVQYTVDGHIYNVRLNSYSASMRKGDTYTMYFSPDAPHAARRKTALGSVLFLCIGGGFFLFGAVGLTASALRRGRKRQLLEKGDAVTARITAVVCAENVTVNGRTPYYVFCETGAVPALAGRRLKSGYVYTPLPQTLVGTAVRLYFDPQKPQRYLVDTDSLQIPKDFP